MDMNALMPPAELIGYASGSMDADTFLEMGDRFFKLFREYGGLQPSHRVLDLGTGMHGVAPSGELDVWQSVAPDPNLVVRLPLPVRAEPPRSRA